LYANVSENYILCNTLHFNNLLYHLYVFCIYIYRNQNFCYVNIIFVTKIFLTLYKLFLKVIKIIYILLPTLQIRRINVGLWDRNIIFKKIYFI